MDYNDRKGHKDLNITLTEEVKSESELLRQLEVLLSDFPDYDSPYLRSDGDIIISLIPDIKQKRKTTSNLTKSRQTSNKLNLASFKTIHYEGFLRVS